MEQCKCPNCGAPINVARRICEYCGTTFKDEWIGPEYKPELKLVVAQPGVKTLGAIMEVDKFEMEMLKKSDSLDRYVRERLAHVMAKKLMENMNIDYRHGPHLNYIECTAKLRVLDPAFKF